MNALLIMVDAIKPVLILLDHIIVNVVMGTQIKTA